MLTNTRTSYGLAARAFHWLSAIAVVAAIAFIELKGFFPKGTPLRDAMKLAHFQAGLIVLLLVLPRLMWRFTQHVPDITPKPDRRVEWLSHLAHWALYALMIALPVLGIVALQNFGREIHFLGFTLPTFITVSEDTAGEMMELHELLGNVILWLSVLHAAAAVWHHRFVKDNTLTRMIGKMS